MRGSRCWSNARALSESGGRLMRAAVRFDPRLSRRSTWAACSTLAAAVAEVDPRLPLTLLVVPDYHALDTACPRGIAPGWILGLPRGTRSRSMAIRTATRRRLRVRRATACCGAATRQAKGIRRLSREAPCASSRGLATVVREARLAARGFVAPAWLMSRGAWDALSAFLLEYTRRSGAFTCSRGTLRNRAQSVYKRACAPCAAGLSRQWNDVLSCAVREAPLVRLGLHPADARHPELIEHMQPDCWTVVRRGRTGMTKIEYARLARRS